MAASRTPNNIYMLHEIKRERCCLGKENESWLWHRRMRHIHFGNLIKIGKKQAIREMLEIKKPKNSMCEPCQHGKQTRVEFKTKEHSTTRPLKLVHTDLCGPTGIKGLNGENTSCFSFMTSLEWLGCAFWKGNQKPFVGHNSHIERGGDYQHLTCGKHNHSKFIIRNYVYLQPFLRHV